MHTWRPEHAFTLAGPFFYDRLRADTDWGLAPLWFAGNNPRGNYLVIPALLTYHEMHPEAELHGVDLSAPCLKIANQRARERGVTLFLSQQDLEHLDYADGTFDLVFFNFMLHELPPANTPALLREACRVLKPGGVFGGHEFHLRPGDHFQNAIQRTHAWTNNETYATPWYETPIADWAREAGFSKTTITIFDRLNRSVKRFLERDPVRNREQRFDHRLGQLEAAAQLRRRRSQALKHPLRVLEQLEPHVDPGLRPLRNTNRRRQLRAHDPHGEEVT